MQQRTENLPAVSGRKHQNFDAVLSFRKSFVSLSFFLICVLHYISALYSRCTCLCILFFSDIDDNFFNELDPLGNLSLMHTPCSSSPFCFREDKFLE